MKYIYSAISYLYNKLYWFIKIRRYESYGNDYVFDVKIDDLCFKLGFFGQTIGPAIVQRIEGVREPETMAIYRTLIRPGDKVLELGACYGEFTVLIDYLVGRGNGGKLVSVEGTPNTYKILEKNIEINNLKNTEIYELFITNSPNNVIYNNSDTHPYNAIERLKNTQSDYINGDILQKSMKISEFLEKINFNPDVIVMDIEGFEVDVLEDLLNPNNKKIYRPTIFFEIHEDMYNKGIDYIYSLLDKAEYTHINIAGNLLCYRK